MPILVASVPGYLGLCYDVATCNLVLAIDAPRINLTHGLTNGASVDDSGKAMVL